MIRKKAKGGVLQFVVVIGLIIATLVLSFMLLLDINQSFRIKQEIQRSLFTEANDLIIQSLSSTDSISELKASGLISELTTFNDEVYGFFVKRSCTVIRAENSHKSVALIGVKKIPEQSEVLHLTNSFSPLYLGGRASIEGKVKMSEEGIRIGSLGGKPFSGHLKIYSQEASSQSLPRLSKKLNSLFEREKQQNVNEVFDLKNFPSSYSNSFKDNTQHYNSQEPIILKNTQLVGNIIVSSQKKITVEASTQLLDVILMAPEIILRKGVKGRFQAFATSKLLVESNCQLDYPSVLWLHQNKSYSGSEGTDFIVRGNTKIMGVLGFSSSIPRTTMGPAFTLHPDVNIYGEVYSELPLDIAANIKGTLYAENVISMANGTIFTNHLVDTQLTPLQQEEMFAGITFDHQSPNTVIKWLD